MTYPRLDDDVATEAAPPSPSSYDYDHLARERSVRGQFLRDVMAATPPGPDRDVIMRTGLLALDGQDDLEAR